MITSIHNIHLLIEVFMKRMIGMIFLLSLLLGACAPAASQAVKSPSPLAPASATPVATQTGGSADPTTTSSSSAAAGSTVVFKIDPAQSKVTYTVSETLFNQNNRINTAIGVTNAVNGQINANLADPAASTLGPITVDVSQFTSDSPQRDNMIRRNFLQSSAYPTATFVTKQLAGMPSSYTEGTSYTFQAIGDLTVKTTTQPVTFTITAKLQNNTLTGEATAQVLMSQFGVGPISLLGMLKTEDQVKITFDFVAKPG
jgi:polyisoprenoid-binding protein YceI